MLQSCFLLETVFSHAELGTKMSKFEKKNPSASVPNGWSQIATHCAITWFKCKFKPPKNRCSFLFSIGIMKIVSFYTFMWILTYILARLNATCFDKALLLAHFWSQRLTNLHKWPFVLKLRTWSFKCTYCHDPTIPIMGPKLDETGSKLLTKIVYLSQACWHACLVSLAPARV